MTERKIKKTNCDNRFSKSGKRRLGWIAVEVILLGLAIVALYGAIRTRADEGVGSGWQEHQLKASDLPCEGGIEGDAVSAYLTDPTVWRPCPWDGADSSPVTESEAFSSPELPFDPVEQTTAIEEGRGETETERKYSREGMIYHSRPNDRMEIALSFDDGPHPKLTPVILSILAEYGIKATFFMVGENVGYYPAAARAVADGGHEIGNHTFSHRKFGRLGEEEIRCEIFSCEEAISRVSDAPVRLIRPPEGQMSAAMRQAIGELDYRVILWDVDTRDWAHTPPETIARHVLDTVQAGDIILMHDFIGYSSPTPEALRILIPALLERGFHFATVGELVAGD